MKLLYIIYIYFPTIILATSANVSNTTSAQLAISITNKDDVQNQHKPSPIIQTIIKLFESNNFQTLSDMIKDAVSKDEDFPKKFVVELAYLESQLIPKSEYKSFWKTVKKVAGGRPHTKLYESKDTLLQDSLVFREEHDKTDIRIYENDIENEKPYDAVCDTYSSKYMPYTGFRFATTVSLKHFLLRKKTSHLIYCYQGKEVARTFRQHSIGRTDILWGEKYCFAPAGQDMEKEDFPTVSGCYVPVRHFRSHTRERFTRVSWNRPERFYGGLFKYVEKASGFTETRGGIFDTPILKNSLAIPVGPLVSDEPYMGFVSILAEEHKYNMFMPVAYTPDYFSEGYPTETDEWAENMDINEDYTSPRSLFDEWDSGPIYEYIPMPKAPDGWKGPIGRDQKNSYEHEYRYPVVYRSVSISKRRKTLIKQLSSFVPLLHFAILNFESLKLENLPKNSRDYVSILKKLSLQKTKTKNALTNLLDYVKNNFLEKEYETGVDAQWKFLGNYDSHYTSPKSPPHIRNLYNLYNDENSHQRAEDPPAIYYPTQDPYRIHIPEAEPNLVDELVDFFVDTQMRLVVNQLKTRLLLLEDKRLAKYLYMAAYYYVFPY